MARGKRMWLTANGLLFAAVVFVGCKSSTTSNSNGRVASKGSDSTNQVELMCVGDRISNPSEPFHYSYKYSGSAGSIENQADITPQAMDVNSKDSSGSRKYHGVRSDETSWNTAVLDLSSLRFTGLSARIESLNGTSALVSRGAESVNGYNTIKYAIDTTRANTADRQQFETLFNKGSFEKGTIWVPADGCAVKMDLDEAIVQNDGSIDQGHYELALVKK
jgi:hypothetical protein